MLISKRSSVDVKKSSSNRPFFSSKLNKREPYPVQMEKFSRSKLLSLSPQNQDNWVQDKGGSLYYGTDEEAGRRMKSLKATGKWKEYRISSFERGGKIFWRVEMRGENTNADKTEESQEKPNEEGRANENKKQSKEAVKKDQEKTDKNSTVKPPKAGSPPAEIKFALTFDDGPHAAELGKGKNRTERVLDVLKNKGIKAGFFIQTGVSYRGANIVGKTLVKRMQKEGHIVGIHTGGTTDHELHTKTQKAGMLAGELEAAKNYVKKETGEAATYVRPPTGARNADVEKTYDKVGLTNLLWDIDGDEGKDMSLSDLKKKLEREMSKVNARNWIPTTAIAKIVVLYHDIQKGTSDHIATLIESIKTLTTKLTGGKSKAKFEKP